MTKMTSALCWAVAILAIALASMMNWIPESSSTTLLIVLPIAAFLSITGRGRCGKGSRA